MIGLLLYLLKVVAWTFWGVFSVALFLALVRFEVVRGAVQLLDHHYKLRTDFVKEFEKTATRPQERSRSPYN